MVNNKPKLKGKTIINFKTPITQKINFLLSDVSSIINFFQIKIPDYLINFVKIFNTFVV